MSVTPQATPHPYTGLILLSGLDTPGITEALFSALSPFAVTILDIEQVVIRGRLILTVLISLNPNHAQAIESDLLECGASLEVDIAISFSHFNPESIAAKSGLLHVTVLGNPLKPAAIAAIAGVVASVGANIGLRIRRFWFIAEGDSVRPCERIGRPRSGCSGSTWWPDEMG
jgi:phosphoserine phosphatase